VRAVSFNVTVPGFLMGKALGGFSDAFLFGRASGLRLADVAEPALPGHDWVRLQVLKAGICGSDVGNLTFKASPAMEPFGSFPAVLGHEVVARVVEVGPGVRRVEPGQRVAVDPVVSCTLRGYSQARACRSCSEGLPATCERAGEEGEFSGGGRGLARGMTIGYHADLPGGWGERMIAHESQLFPLDDAMDDRTAVLIEPLAVGMHAVLGMRPWGAGPVLVVGSGPIALGTVWALRAAGYQGELVAQMKRGHEAALARRLGATSVVSPGDEARDALVATGAQGYMPIVGDEVYAGGGFPLVFDCVGSGDTLKQCMRYAAPRGRIVMLGCAAEIRKLDLTFVWARELAIRGFVCYGLEEWRGARAHTFQITHDLLVEGGAPVSDMVTHVYPLAQYREALSAAAHRRRSGAVKVLLDPAVG
jgi:threonine dehydrogenase-like Zn-dependent dehydrogenase